MNLFEQKSLTQEELIVDRFFSIFHVQDRGLDPCLRLRCSRQALRVKHPKNTSKTRRNITYNFLDKRNRTQKRFF